MHLLVSFLPNPLDRKVYSNNPLLSILSQLSYCKNEHIYFCPYHNNHNKSAHENLRKKCLYCPHNNQTVLTVHRTRNGIPRGISYRNINHHCNALHPSSNQKHIACRPNNKDHKNQLVYRTDYVPVGRNRNNLIRHQIGKQFLLGSNSDSTLDCTYFRLRCILCHTDCR